MSTPMILFLLAVEVDPRARDPEESVKRALAGELRGDEYVDFRRATAGDIYRFKGVPDPLRGGAAEVVPPVEVYR